MRAARVLLLAAGTAHGLRARLDAVDSGGRRVQEIDYCPGLADCTGCAPAAGGTCCSAGQAPLCLDPDDTGEIACASCAPDCESNCTPVPYWDDSCVWCSPGYVSVSAAIEAGRTNWIAEYCGGSTLCIHASNAAFAADAMAAV